jgi:hypothetical protein
VKFLIAIFRVTTSCSLIGVYQRFKGDSCVDFEGFMQQVSPKRWQPQSIILHYVLWYAQGQIYFCFLPSLLANHFSMEQVTEDVVYVETRLSDD